MGKGGGSAPPPPDYAGAAKATAAGDLEAARASAAANRVNQITPYGALVYSQQGKFDPRAYEQAYEAYRSSQQGATLPEGYSLTDTNPFAARTSVQPRSGYQYAYGPNGDRIEVPLSGLSAPRVEDFLTAPANQDEGWTARQFLSPEQQRLLDYQNATSMGLGELTGTGLDYVKGMMKDPFSTSSLPSLQSNIGNANLQQLTGNADLGMVGQGPQFNQIGNAAQLQKSLQDQGMAGWDRASELMMQRLRPQMDIQNENLDVRLANQGIAAGTEAYNRAKQSLGMQQNDLLTQAQLQSQGIGQNLFNQALQGGQFTNTALTQENQNQLANLAFNNQLGQQGYANQLAAQAANNPALQQMYQNQQAQQQANNAIAQQMFGNQFTNANLSNSARQQGFNELAYMRNEPLNTLNAVRTGAQVTNPSYVSVPQQATTKGADLLGAATAEGNYNQASANAAQAGQAGMTSGLVSLGSTAMMAF